ncbi:MAG: internalization-related competence protein ComEC/Rec2 [Herbaspirillum sp.]|nr:internalization-related competence protein ComEC/Rec2 [Herbaspirillum sp.]
MRCALLAYAAGIAGLQTLAVLPAQRWCMALALASLASAWLLLKKCPVTPPVCDAAHAFRRTPFPWLRLLISAACAASIGFAWAALCAHDRLRDRLAPEWEGRDVTVIGAVDNLPVSFERGRRFLFSVERVLPRNGAIPHLPARLSLSWYAGRGAKARLPEIAPGARWRLTVRLTRPHGNANPDGFDYELWLLERGIGATGYVRDVDPHTAPRLLNPFVFSAPHAIERLRGRVRRKILAALPQAAHAGVIVALALGEQRAIEKSDWDVFRRTGVSHLIAISGLHIMLVAGLFGRLVTALWRRSFWIPSHWMTPLPLRLPAQKAALPAAVAGAAGYVVLAGCGIPAQRALYMLIAVALAAWFGRIGSAAHILCIALAVVLTVDPWALLWPGFHLSFAAVAIILYAGGGRGKTGLTEESDSAPTDCWRHCRRLLRTLADGMRTQWAVTVGLLPLTLLLFAQYSLIGPIANALAIPAVTLLIAPLALLGSVLPAPLASWALTLAHAAFSLLFDWLNWCSTLPTAVWRAPLPSWPLFLAALSGALLILAPRGWPLRWVGCFGCLPLLLNTPMHPPAGALWVTAFDVGQGMALLIETRTHRLLYDTGPPYGTDSDAGDRVLLPYLQARGIGALDALVVSHSDSDHAGGAATLLRALPIATVYTSLPARHRIVRAAAQHRRCIAGQHWQWDGVTFDMLHPTAAVYANRKGSPNARSCVLKISNGKHAVLLPGDIGAAQEKDLIDRLGAHRLRASVLLAPHHGSKTSSSPAFLQAVDPAIAVFQTGYRNRFHHPQAKIYDRYRDSGIRRLRTDQTGAITLQLGTVVLYQTYRQQHARYWHSGPSPLPP